MFTNRRKYHFSSLLSTSLTFCFLLQLNRTVPHFVNPTDEFHLQRPKKLRDVLHLRLIFRFVWKPTLIDAVTFGNVVDHLWLLTGPYVKAMWSNRWWQVIRLDSVTPFSSVNSCVLEETNWNRKVWYVCVRDDWNREGENTLDKQQLPQVELLRRTNVCQ